MLHFTKYSLQLLINHPEKGRRSYRQIFLSTVSKTSLNNNCSEIVSANTGFSISIYNVTSRNIYLRWSKFSGAFSYRITATPRNTVGHSLLAHFSDVPVIGILTSLTPNTVHTVKVEAIDKNGIILAEAQTKQLTAPEIPVIDQAYSKLSNSITVEWAAVPGATSYLLTAQDGESSIETIVINSPGTVTGLKANTLYKITIRSINAGGRSLPSPSKKAKTGPHAPSDVQVAFDSGTLRAIVSWIPTEGTLNYSVTASSGASKLNCSTSSTSCPLSSLQCGSEYSVYVVASNGAGSSKPTDAVSLKTVPCAPGSITIEEDNPGKLSVSWSNVDLGDYYVVFVKSDDGLEVHCNTSHTQCHFQSDCGFTYFISVFAYNKAGQSPLGDIFNYTTSPCCPSDFYPVFVSSDTVEIVWSPVRGAEMYETKAVDGVGVVLCHDTATICILTALQCNTQYNITVYSYSEIRGTNTSCVSKYVATAPCSPEIKNISQDDLSIISVHWQANNDDAIYTVTARGEVGLWHCTSSGNSCSITGLPCGSVFSISAVAITTAGQSLPSYNVPLETAPCCPNDLTVTQVMQSITNISWSFGAGAKTYITILESPKGPAKCHTLQNHCLLGCITCGTNYTVSLKVISETGLASDCTYQDYSSSACCPSGVKLYRLGNNGIRIYWHASAGLISTDLYGSKGNFTCTPPSGLSYCDVTEIPCGDVYTVVVSPVPEKGSKLPFCPKKIYSVTCSGSSVGMVIYRGKRSAE
ncbi:fibronectin type III domain-containing protein 7 isoform X4 [Mauremys mutica]|uniref:fibronectin type III domain-containing protein 7 isoform X4 n=1 Tax=Mauremys mutica TaxID=74926 RepID=UPI001D166A8B|nr:fibronectin type III domain-containing protein 7 isoform X4 [Mauremys mutica]